jgi:DNA-binding GntR family transcriptional regulator
VAATSAAIFKPAPSSSAMRHVVDELRKAISSGRLPPGARLVEISLADQFQVSRGPIREALRVLSYEGLVTLRPNRGAVVSSLTAEDILEVYVIRAVLGSVAIRQLIGAGLVTDEVLDRLRALAARARQRSNRSRQDRLVDCDLAFQSGIIESCGLPRVTMRFRESTAEVRMFIAASGIQYTNVDQILADHDDLLAAIEARDVDRANALWHKRMHTAVREFLELVPDGEAIEEKRPWLWQLL